MGEKNVVLRLKIKLNQELGQPWLLYSEIQFEPKFCPK